MLCDFLLKSRYLYLTMWQLEIRVSTFLRAYYFLLLFLLFVVIVVVIVAVVGYLCAKNHLQVYN